VHALTHVQIDLGTPSGPIQAVKRAIETYGKLDGLVVNHAVLSPVERIASPNLEYLGSEDGEEKISASIQRWKAAFDVNFFSGVALVKAAAPYLRRAAGQVVFVSSSASVNAYPALCSYCASKAALDAFCRNLALEEPMITSISLDPGMVDTGIHREVQQELYEAMGHEFHESHKNVKLLKPDQPGAVIANLVLRGTKQLSGGCYSWNADELMDYQGTAPCGYEKKSKI